MRLSLRFGGVFDNWAGEIVEHLGVGEEFFDCAKDCNESDGDRAIDLKTNFFFYGIRDLGI